MLDGGRHEGRFYTILFRRSEPCGKTVRGPSTVTIDRYYLKPFTHVHKRRSSSYEQARSKLEFVLQGVSNRFALWPAPGPLPPGDFVEWHCASRTLAPI